MVKHSTMTITHNTSLRSLKIIRFKIRAEAPNTPMRPWRMWAQTISMASCLISNQGNSAKTDLIRQSKVWSYPWNKQTNKVEDILLKSTQYKKLVPNALQFTCWNLKSYKSHEKNETKNIRLLFFSFSSINLAFCFIFWCCLQDFKFQYVNRKAFCSTF